MHRSDGDSVVPRHGLVLNGHGQHGAQHGLTCPDRRQGHKRAQGGAARLGGISWRLVRLPASNTRPSPGTLGNHSQFREVIKVTPNFSGP